MTIRFQSINPDAYSYPKARLPIQPPISLSTLKAPVDKDLQSSAFIDQGAFLSNARTCLAHAFVLSGASPENSVLLPAYHCGSMVEPALWLNADVLFYRLKSDLSPDPLHLENLIRNATKPICAMLLPHYFGFPQDLSYWRIFCDAHNIKLIEDCAHAFFGSTGQGQTLGTIGDYAVASVKKFFCSPDGGILIGKNLQASRLSTISPTLTRELHALLQALLVSAEFGKLGLIGRLILRLDHWRSRIKRQPPSKPISSQKNEIKTATWSWFDPTSLNTKGLAVSQLLMKHSRAHRIKDIRRKNYVRLLEGISAISHLTPLFPELPDHVVPYMFPVLLDAEQSYFSRLKNAGIPLWRWEELAESDCAISQNYRLHLLQIPCHQDLSAIEIDWTLQQLSEILGRRKS